jgi:putative redox protein
MARPVRVESTGGLRQEISIGPHRLTADEPVEAGGGDTGPGPRELLLAALGS